MEYQNRPDYNKMYLDHNPVVEHILQDQIILKTDSAYFRFHISGNCILIFGDFGTGVYRLSEMNWMKLKEFSESSFEYFIEKCIASDYGKHWVDGEYRHSEDETPPEPASYAWGQWLALKKMIQIKFQ